MPEKRLLKDLIHEWAPDNPPIEEFKNFSNKRVNWICSRGHFFDATINNRTRNKTNCSFCSNRKALSGFNDLYSQAPNLSKEWDFSKNTKKPNEVVVSSSKKYWWICNKGHSFQASVRMRSGKNSEGRRDGCPYCSNRRILSGFNDLNTMFPEILNEWDYDKNHIKPTELMPGSSIKVWWLCQKGHSFLISPHSRIRLGVKKTGCNRCQERKFEDSLRNFFENLRLDFKQNDRTYIRPLELDFVFPKIGKAIEANGEYWHSDESIMKSGKWKSAVEYHENKKLRAKESGLELKFVWSKEWYHSRFSTEVEIIKFLLD